MTRMVRGINPPVYGPVADYTVAEHRYLWSGAPEAPMGATWRQVKDLAPYKVGEVVYVAHEDGFRKAMIYVVDCYKDRFDDWKEQYKVFLETKKGTWSKQWKLAYPGYIQRGYQRAGLAPDIPEGLSGWL